MGMHEFFISPPPPPPEKRSQKAHALPSLILLASASELNPANTTLQ